MSYRVLIANRGEIAVRVIRACRDLGLETVAVHAESDRESPHVWLADRAYGLGPDSAAPYLSIDRLLDAARETGAQLVHPGYGFLSENGDFARAVEQAGLTWVGPPSASIRVMGEKTAARTAMTEAGVPVVPGTLEPVSDGARAEAEAAEVGLPVLLKAAAGGGGKGMRVVERASDIGSSFDAASREARKAFGDPAIYIERYLPSVRHVEVQIMADRQGRTIHVGERECSLQRRHQKLLEEAPAPGLDADLRGAIGEVAVTAARAVNYVGAGTVEFLLTADGSFFFLEMNTRIQVEHPVTELVSGLDLVRMQLEIALGEPLRIEQSDVSTHGHAIECRIVAEDPTTGFLPSTGKITAYRPPSGPGVRFDSGVAEGVVVGPHYDPMLAKCVTWGANRKMAIERMERALRETIIGGVTTNIAFQRALLAEPAVRAGAVDTRFLESRASGIGNELRDRASEDAAAAAALAALAVDRQTHRPVDPGNHRSSERDSRWRSNARWVWYR